MDLDMKEYPGVVIGAETEFFWLLVPDLGNVYQGHPDRVASLPDRKVFWVHDRCKSVKALFDKNGKFCSDIFFLAKNPKPMIDLLSAHRLIGALDISGSPESLA